MRRILGAVVLVVGLAVLVADPAAAAAVRGSTSVGGAVGGASATVVAVIADPAPIAPYEYWLQNRCWFSGRTNGRYDASERVELPGPWYLDVDQQRTTTVTVNLSDVPSGSVCQVTIMKGTSAVKGSASSYAVS